jgi:ribosomal protein S18 acetylase RimI-like enzyme
MNASDNTILRVSYMRLTEAPSVPHPHTGAESIALEQMTLAAYLALYRRVGGPLRWDQRLRMPEAALEILLSDNRLRVYVLRDSDHAALGFCEFDHGTFPQVELKNFGLVPEAQGRGLGRYLLATSLNEEWKFNPTQIWLHTDTWDHPAAIHVYERFGFHVYSVVDEPAGSL